MKGMRPMTTNARWMASAMAAAVVAFGFAGPARAVQGGKSPVQVFILAGQSNMEGHGEVNINPKSTNGGKGTLQHMVKNPATAAQCKHIVDAAGNWAVRSDVWIWYLGRSGRLSIPRTSWARSRSSAAARNAATAASATVAAAMVTSVASS